MNYLSDLDLARLHDVLGTTPTSIITVDCPTLRALVAEARDSRMRLAPRCFYCWRPLPADATTYHCKACFDALWFKETV